jgi:hypothetical protein
MRLDSERGDPAEFQLELEAEGVGIVTGPAGIAWRPTDVVASGDFRAEATFVQYEAPIGYREAYGVFVGGSDLQGPDQEYIYLLVRPTGDFLVKRARPHGVAGIRANHRLDILVRNWALGAIPPTTQTT